MKEKRPVGRPPVLTPALRETILDALRKAMPLSYACDLAGIDRNTVYNEMKRDRNFSAQIAIAKAEAIKGLVSLTAKQGGGWKLLKNLGREEFKEHVEVEQNETHRFVIDPGDGEPDEFNGF